MSRNGSGTHTPSLTFTPSTPALSADVNAVLEDMADEITNSLALDGQSAMTGQIKAADGTASLPGYTFDSDQNTGIYRISSDTIGIAVAGALVCRVNSSGITLESGKSISGPSFVPSGLISLWSGTVATIPSGWLLCDGTNSTPDLRDKFVIGARQDSSGAKTNVTGALTQSGGSKDAVAVSHSHTGTTATEGAHTHGYTYYSGPAEAAGGGVRLSAQNAGAGTTGAGSAHSHTFTTGSTGSSGTNANLPPYYALAFIMKA